MARQALSNSHDAEYRTNAQPPSMFDTPASGQERRGYSSEDDPDKYTSEDDDLKVFTVFESFLQIIGVKGRSVTSPKSTKLQQ